MHLLEDTSQPQHVRNEQHVNPFVPNSWKEQHDPWASPIEIYGYNNVNNLNYGDGTMLDWRGAGFTKLEDFWDRHIYNGSSAALDAAESGGPQLGLAEWCNGNFLGDRHSYSEYFREYNSDGTPDIMWYPYPSLFTSTPYLQHGAFIDTVALKNGKVISRYYLPKTGDGIQVDHFSTLSYFGTLFPNRIFKVATSIRDNNVLSDYHDAFIPKAVEYSAGLLDYFFRGTMSAAVVDVEASVPQYTVAFTNTSSQDFSNGTFYVFQQDPAGNRSLVAQTNLIELRPDGILATNSSVEATFSGNLSTNQLIFLYRGTIGVSNGAPLDPVDAGMAIAISVPPAIRVTANPLWTDSGITVTNGETLGIFASGTWNWPGGTDANGVNDGSTDLFLGGVNHAALIAYVGTYPPYDDATGTNRWGDSSYFPQTPGHGYWLAGKNAQITTDRGGELWFLINDDAVTEQISDNSGALSVTVFTGN